MRATRLTLPVSVIKVRYLHLREDGRMTHSEVIKAVGTSVCQIKTGLNPPRNRRGVYGSTKQAAIDKIAASMDVPFVTAQTYVEQLLNTGTLVYSKGRIALSRVEKAGKHSRKSAPPTQPRVVSPPILDEDPERFFSMLLHPSMKLGLIDLPDRDSTSLAKKAWADMDAAYGSIDPGDLFRATFWGSARTGLNLAI